MKPITMTTKTYRRTASGKSWQAQPSAVETETITEEQYNRIVCDDTLRWFRRLGGSETAIRCYTSRGYNVVQLTSCNPDRTVKKVRVFDIE